LIRVVRFIIEVGFVIQPSRIWLISFVVLEFPSTLMYSFRILRSCGITHKSLSALLVRPDQLISSQSNADHCRAVHCSLLAFFIQTIHLPRWLRCPKPNLWQRWITRSLTHDHNFSVGNRISSAIDIVNQQTTAAAQALAVSAGACA
jgi:hypothetical protein